MIQPPLPFPGAKKRSARLRAACKAVAKEYGYKTIAALWRCDEDTVGQKIDEKNRNCIHPDEMLELKRLDARGVIKAAEDAELTPSPSAEQVVARIPGVLRKYFSEHQAQAVESDLWGVG